MQRFLVTRTRAVLLSVLLLGSCAAGQAWAGYLDVVEADNPLGYWRLNEASGTAAVNLGSTGTAGNGTYVDFAASDYGKPGALTASGDTDKAMGFLNTVGTHITIPESVVGTVSTGAFSVEMWFKYQPSQNSGAQRGELFSYGNNDDPFGVWQQSIGGLDYLGVAAQGNYGFVADVSADQWNHLVLTRDALSTNVSVYLNGALAGTVAGSSTANLGSVGHDLWIGAVDYGVVTYPMTGSIDEVAIYGQALSADTIKAHYDAGMTPTPEPASAILLGSAVVGLLAYAWRKRR